VFFWLTCILLNIGACGPLLASTLLTSLGGIAEDIKGGVEAYARDHNGTPPESWGDLRTYQSWGDFRPYLDFDHVENTFKMPVQSAMMMMGEVHPTLEGTDPEKIVAMTAFNINEDWREEIGRYVVVQRGDGEFTFHWANESAILKACAAVNVMLPPTAVFQEKPRKVRGWEYVQPRMLLVLGSVAALIIVGAIFWRRHRGAAAKHRSAELDRLDETKDDIVIKW
jgi:hypothetical protein